MLDELPEAKGTYLLWSRIEQRHRLEIGRLGAFDLVPGYYGYVGSAQGHGGLRARLRHHLESTADPHWHIDYLLRQATPVEVWCAVADRKLEHDWAELLGASFRFLQPIPRFGSSDYRRSATPHLFYLKSRPPYGWFQQQMTASFASDIKLLRLVFYSVNASTAKRSGT
jgi:Uri superfamily endonuclease